MANGIGGIGGYAHLSRLRQAQGGNSLNANLFGKADANGDKSISRDEWTAFQSNLTAQLQGSQSSAASGSPQALLSLLQNPAQIGTTASSTSASGTANDAFSKIDTNGDGSVSKDELTKALFSVHYHLNTGADAGSRSSSSAVAEQLFKSVDTNGDSSISKDELTAFQSSLTSRLLNGNGASGAASNQTGGEGGLTSLIQQAIGKYMQFTPVGRGVAQIGSFLGLA